MANRTDIADIEAFNAGPNDAVIKTIQVNASMTECPAIILANRRTVKAKGFVKIPNSSIKGIIGIGTFSHNGTSGHNISFQYSLFPQMFTARNVIHANTNVMAMFPVTFPPPGKIGINPIKLLIKIKKKAVNK